MYDSGVGTPQDSAEAAIWLRKAADQGNAEAQHALGIAYDQGRGVPQDYAFAHMWFNLAAARSHPTRSRFSMSPSMPAGGNPGRRPSLRFQQVKTSDAP